MGEWFNQARFDLNGQSTKGLVEWARDRVDMARLFDRIDHPPRVPEQSVREARAAIDRLFDDKPAGLVLNEAGQSRDALMQALEVRKFEAVLSGLGQAIRHGSERESPPAAALAAPAIEAQARHNAAGQKRSASTNVRGMRQVSADQSPAARERLRPATQDATRSYWEAAAESGRKINSTAQPAGSSKPQATRGRGHGRSR